MKRKVYSIIVAFVLSNALISYSQGLSKKTSAPQLKSKFFFELNYEELLKSENPTYLSNIALDVKYICLETNENCLIGPLTKYYFCDDLIFVSTNKYILQFSSDGKFINQIGKPGKGPGEISSITSVSFIPKKKIVIIHDTSKKQMMYFSFDGQLIKTVHVPYSQSIKVMVDGNYLTLDGSYGNAENFYFYVTKEGKDTLSYVKNPIKWTTNFSTPTTFRNPTFEPFYHFQDKYFAKTMFNDTIYVANARKIEPAYFINLGKFKLPEEKRAERLPYEQAVKFRDMTANYYWANVFESGSIIFLKTYCFGKGNPGNVSILINKNSLISNSKFDYKAGASMGPIINNFDGGPFFWPEGSVNDDQVFMPIDVIRMKKFLELMKSSKMTVKFKDKQKDLETMVLNLDDASNPVLMLVTLKH